MNPEACLWGGCRIGRLVQVGHGLEIFFACHDDDGGGVDGMGMDGSADPVDLVVFYLLTACFACLLGCLLC